MKHSLRILSVIILGSILLAAVPCFGRVLIIHSYHEEYDWVEGINNGLQSLFNSNVTHRVFYMDTKRHPDEQWKIQAAKKARDLIEAYAPEVVIAVDDNAQKYVVKYYAGKSPIQFVFCGVNAEPSAYGYPSPNVTGILERPYPQQVLKMLRKFDHKINSVAWVSDDSATAHALLPWVRNLANAGKLPLRIVDYQKPRTFDQWKEAITAHDQNPDIHALLIPLYHTVKNNTAGKSIQPSEVMRWTATHTTKPVVGFWPFSTDDGALCAVAVDPYEHGKVAAFMAKQILAGKKASQIPIVTNQNGYVIINLKSAHHLNVDVPFELIQSADRIIE